MMPAVGLGSVIFETSTKSIFWKLKGKTKAEDRDGREKGRRLVNYILHVLRDAEGRSEQTTGVSKKKSEVPASNQTARRGDT